MGELDVGISTRLLILEKLIDIYTEFIESQNLYCRKHCAHCCTANVTLTTLEGLRMVTHLEQTSLSNPFLPFSENVRPDRFVPRISINAMADICSRDGDLPEEILNPDAGPCPALADDICTLYPVRPFGCRCMVSSENCGETGCATLDPFILTVNNVFFQVIEHIDAKGGTGNLSDVILFLSTPENRKNYENGRFDTLRYSLEQPLLVPNQPVFVLMIPPEHRDRIAPIMERIHAIQI